MSSYHSLLKGILKPTIRWYFQKAFKKNYNERRARLLKCCQEDQSVMEHQLLAIDYIIENCQNGKLKNLFAHADVFEIEDDNGNDGFDRDYERDERIDCGANYPPSNETVFLAAFNLGLPRIIEQILIIYLVLDAEQEWSLHVNNTTALTPTPTPTPSISDDQAMSQTRNIDDDENDEDNEQDDLEHEVGKSKTKRGRGRPRSGLSTTKKNVARNLENQSHKCLEEMYEQIIRLPVAFQFPRSVINLATGLWGLDNGRFDVTVRHLTAPGVSMQNLCQHFTQNVLISQHMQKSVSHHANDGNLHDFLNSIVIRSLVLQGENKRAYLISQSFPRAFSDFRDIYQHMHILLCCGQLMLATKFQRLLRSRKDHVNIMSSFLSLCDENNQIENFCKFKLDDYELDCLERYHAKSSHAYSHHLHGADYHYNGTQSQQSSHQNQWASSQETVSEFGGSSVHSCRTPTKQHIRRQKPKSSTATQQRRMLSLNDTPAHRTRSKTGPKKQNQKK